MEPWRTLIHRTDLTPDISGYDTLTVKDLREALVGLADDLEVESGWYTCHGVGLKFYDLRDGGQQAIVDIVNSE